MQMDDFLQTRCGFAPVFSFKISPSLEIDLLKSSGSSCVMLPIPALCASQDVSALPGAVHVWSVASGPQCSPQPAR